MRPLISEKKYFGLFKISLYIKTINAIADLAAGVVIWVTSKAVLIIFLLDLFQHELSDDPKDLIANFIVNSAEALSVSSQYVLGAYLFIHGIVKLFLVICLFKRKLWAYPVSIIIFSSLIFYEIYVYINHSSLWTLIFIIFDVILVLLTGHEYGVLIKRNKNEKIL